MLHLAAGLVQGGLELQGENTRRALESIGVEVRVLSPEDRDFKGDIVHFFGTYPGYPMVCRACQVRNVPYVCTPVLLVHQHGPALRFRSWRKRFVQGSFPKDQRDMYRKAARLLTLTSAEEKNLDDYFGKGLAPKVRIPIGIDERFGKGDPEVFRTRYDHRAPFVLHTGRFEERKNQLGLIRALKGKGIRVVLIGSSEDKAYEEACLREGKGFVDYLGRIPLDDPALSGAYAAAKVFCMPSGSEVLSASALEAAVAGLPSVLGNGWGAESYLGSDAKYVDPKSTSQIQKAILEWWEAPGDRAARAARYGPTFRWETVAGQIAAQYEAVLREFGQK